MFALLALSSGVRVWEKPDVVFMPESLCDRALSSGVREWDKPDVVVMLEGPGRIVASKRSSMKDVEKRTRETCQVLQLLAEDFVYFTDVT